MAKLRFTKSGKSRNKNNFKRKVKIRKYTRILLYISFISYIAHKENLIEKLITFLQ